MLVFCGSRDLPQPEVLLAAMVVQPTMPGNFPLRARRLRKQRFRSAAERGNCHWQMPRIDSPSNSSCLLYHRTGWAANRRRHQPLPELRPRRGRQAAASENIGCLKGQPRRVLHRVGRPLAVSADHVRVPPDSHLAPGLIVPLSPALPGTSSGAAPALSGEFFRDLRHAETGLSHHIRLLPGLSTGRGPKRPRALFVWRSRSSSFQPPNNGARKARARSSDPFFPR